MVNERLQRLREFLQKKKLEAVLINKEVNLHYFSGFRGDDTYLLVSQEKAMLITDSRYTEQAASQAPLFEVIEHRDGLIKKTVELANQEAWHTLAFEGNAMYYNSFSKLEALLDEAYLEPVNLEPLRMVKSAEEIACIKKACEIGDRAFEDIIKFIRPGVSEIEIAARLEAVMRGLGSERPAFTTIVASGERGSLPHGIATEKLIVGGEFVTMDYGAVYHGYHSDMTRTICVGKASDEQRKVYQLVLEAQQRGVKAVRAGVSGQSVDSVARDYLDKAGYGQYFGHALGHSLGLEIHEEPRLSQRSDCASLEPGMLVTVEPGVYLPGKFGLRIEDSVLVEKDKGTPLTLSSKDLIEIL